MVQGDAGRIPNTEVLGRKEALYAVVGELRAAQPARRELFKSVVINNSSTVNCDGRVSERAGLLKREGGPERMGWVDYVVLASATAGHAGVCSTDHHFGGFQRIVRAKLPAKA